MEMSDFAMPAPQLVDLLFDATQLEARQDLPGYLLRQRQCLLADLRNGFSTHPHTRMG